MFEQAITGGYCSKRGGEHRKKVGKKTNIVNRHGNNEEAQWQFSWALNFVSKVSDTVINT